MSRPQDQTAPQRSEAMAGRSLTESAAGSARARIVLDASGGDAPSSERVAGALDAARSFPDVHLHVCGVLDRMKAEFEEAGGLPENIELVDAPEPIGMHEPPVQALRTKKNSSIAVGVRMVAEAEADAFVSAGNTGAVTAASTLKLGRLSGVQRPGIAIAMHVIDHPVVVIDVGASVDSKPTHLLQYGIMADVFTRKVLGIERPRIGLLNVGEEAAKGKGLTKRAFELLSDAELNFVGNAEPDKIFEGGCDIMVCDGFVGNVLLKFGESVMMRMVGWLREKVKQRLRYKVGLTLCKDLFQHLKRCADFSEYGGAPLLGVNGVTIISHGASDAQAVRNAIREARAFVELHVNDQMEAAVREDAARRGLRI